MNPLIPAGALLVACWWLLWRRFPAPVALQRRAQGQILEILLYADLPRVTLNILGDVLRTSLRLLWALSPVSLLSLAVAVLMLAGLSGYCNWRPPVVGERLLISAPGELVRPLRVGPGLRLDSQPLLTHSATFWRVLVEKPGRHELWLEGGKAAQLKVGPAWAYLSPQQAGLVIHYPERRFWWRDRPLQWPLGLGLSCLFWFGLGLAFNSCWWILVRQDARSSSRNNKNGGIVGSTASS